MSCFVFWLLHLLPHLTKSVSYVLNASAFFDYFSTPKMLNSPLVLIAVTVQVQCMHIHVYIFYVEKKSFFSVTQSFLPTIQSSFLYALFKVSRDTFRFPWKRKFSCFILWVVQGEAKTPKKKMGCCRANFAFLQALQIGTFRGKWT